MAKKWKTWFFIHNLNLRLLIPEKSNVFTEVYFLGFFEVYCELCNQAEQLYFILSYQLHGATTQVIN